MFEMNYTIFFICSNGNTKLNLTIWAKEISQDSQTMQNTAQGHNSDT